MWVTHQSELGLLDTSGVDLFPNPKKIVSIRSNRKRDTTYCVFPAFRALSTAD